MRSVSRKNSADKRYMNLGNMPSSCTTWGLQRKHTPISPLGVHQESTATDRGRCAADVAPSATDGGGRDGSGTTTRGASASIDRAAAAAEEEASWAAARDHPSPREVRSVGCSGRCSGERSRLVGHRRGVYR